MPISPRPGRAATLLAAATLTAAALAAVVLPPRPASAEPSGQDLDWRISQATQELEVVVEQYNGLREDLRTTRQQTSSLTAKIDPLAQQIQARREQVGVLAAAAYRNGAGLRPMVAMLTSESPQHFVDHLLMLGELSRDQQEVIAALGSSQERFQAARESARQLTTRQQAQEQRLAAKKKQVEGELARLVQLRDGRPVKITSDPRTADHRLPTLSPGSATTAVKYAYAQLGKRYRWGAAGPDAFDCSGLTAAAWHAAGVRLPHSSQRQWSSMTRVSRPELQPGDLIFYYGDIHHVGMYVGGGMMIHAPQEGQPVSLNAVNFQPVYGYGRPR
ncbi:NlpC/P60 family protein [Micromonospora sp. NPDC049679]|uniref:C40 family peptidase n=1 Tax=Micromonospora sp. NPDC049679 TaxID=3155920 RepID=UPI00340A28C0